MLIGTLSSSVPVLPEHSPLNAPVHSEAPLLENFSSSDSEIDITYLEDMAQQDQLAAFHCKSGGADRSWILFDSGASANCCPPWFAENYALLPIGSDCPMLHKSISGKTLDIIGKRVIELDCEGHSMCVHFYVCQSIPFPFVSVARFRLQDF